jgi:hypothetical protein
MGFCASATVAEQHARTRQIVDGLDSRQKTNPRGDDYLIFGWISSV